MTKICKTLGVRLATAMLILSPAHAQIPGGDHASGKLNSVMVKLFGSHTNFIAKVDARTLNKNQQETGSSPMGLEMLAGKTRIDINLNQIKSKDLSPEIATQMKQIGMDQLITIQLTDKKENLFICPSLKAYAETAMTQEEIDNMTKDYKLEKTRLGKETIDGHACEKDNVTLSDDKGVQQRIIVWYATDLKDFPIQFQISEDSDTLIMRFKDIKQGRPDASHFESPTGMTKFDSMEALMTDAFIKKMKEAPAK